MLAELPIDRNPLAWTQAANDPDWSLLDDYLDTAAGRAWLADMDERFALSGAYAD